MITLLVSVSLANVHSTVSGAVEDVVHTFVHNGVRIRFFIAVDGHTITRVLVCTGQKWVWR